MKTPALAGLVLTVLLPSCQSLPKHEAWELSTYTTADKDAFCESMLRRVAPELANRTYDVVSSQFCSDPSTGRILLSSPWNAVLRPAELHADPVPCIGLAVKPAGSPGDMEITVALGALKAEPLPRTSSGPIIGATIGNSSGNGYLIVPSRMRPYRTMVIRFRS